MTWSTKNFDKFAQAHGLPAQPGLRSELILPGHDDEINECGRNCFRVLAKTHRYFVRDRTVFELVKAKDNARLVPVDSEAFCSQLENYFVLRARIKVRNKLELVRRRCSVADAAKLLKCDPALELLPPIKLVTASPVFTEVNGKLEVLRKGYHELLGGIYISRDYAISEVPLDEAVKTLKELTNDFLFVAPSDRSRFLAGLIAPSLRFGGLVDADFPVFINEADESQTGKTYAHKLLCQLYGEHPFTVTQKDDKSGIGSHDEKLSKGMIEGRPFIMWENVRGLVDSQLAESAIRGTGSVLCRVPYMPSIEVPTDKFSWLLSSNKASVTTDFAARALVTRFRKQPPNYTFKSFAEGDLLKHIANHCSEMLSCLLAIDRDWLVQGKPRTADRRHDFTEICQSLDWIVQNILREAPLLDDHSSEQQRISNPLRNWLRDLANCLVRNGVSANAGFRPSELAELCADNNLDIPNCRPMADESERSKTMGKILKRIFGQEIELTLGGWKVRRASVEEYNPIMRTTHVVHYHYFEKTGLS